MIRTFAPSAMHWSACVFCFCGSPWALTTRAETPAALKAFSRYGRSNCSQRTEVLVSGIRPHARIPARFPAVPAPAITAAARATRPSVTAMREIDFTFPPPPSCVALTILSPALLGCRPDTHLLPSRGRPRSRERRQRPRAEPIGVRDHERERPDDLGTLA